jgi:mono/diheme cytochrome c family protein
MVLGGIYLYNTPHKHKGRNVTNLITLAKQSLFIILTTLLLSACGIDNGKDLDDESDDNITVTVESTTTDDTTSSNDTDVFDDSCMVEAYGNGTEPTACAACHVSGGFAGGTGLILSSSNTEVNYQVLKEYVEAGKGHIIINKISAASSESHTGGKASQETVDYFQAFLDAYNNPNICMNSDDSTTSDDTNSSENNSDDSNNDNSDNDDTNGNDNSDDSNSNNNNNSENGETLYIQQCASCHGVDGNGGSGAGPYFVDGSAYDTKESLVAYVTETMPLTNTALCDTACSEAIYDYAKVNFYNPNTDTTPDEPACVEGEASVSPQYIRLLSSNEYKATVTDLLGFTSTATNNLPNDAESGNFHNAVSNSIVDADKMEAYLNVAMNLAEETIATHKSNIISCSATTSGGGSNSCSLTSFVAGDSYATGDKVQHNNRYFQCLQGGWCTTTSAAAVTAYEPGVGYASTSAWTELNSCPADGTDNSDSSNDTCALDFVNEFGRLAYRRALTSSEAQGYVNTIEAASSFDEGLKDTLASMLVSPSFLYRFEVGTNTNQGYAKLSGYETASALSYLLWGSTPDDELLRAAENGSLNSVSGIDAQAQRMIADSRAEKQMVKFTSEWLHTDAASLGEKNSAAYSVSGVKESLVAEFESLAQQAIFEGSGKFSELMNADYFYANDKLDTFYELNRGVTGTSMKKQSAVYKNGQKVRGGAMLTGAFLAAHGHFEDSGALTRGAFIRREVLCHDLPIPPASTDDFDTSPPEADDSITTRELYDAHTSAPECYTCHQSFNDLGFAFENYEGDGRYRETEHGLEIIQAGTLIGLKERLDNITVDFESRDALVDLFSNEESMQGCFATQYFRFAKGYKEDAVDNCAVTTLKEKFIQSGGDIKTLMVELTKLPSFTQRQY